jgi:hypothetical protein
MTAKKNFKRLVRARARKTGESYAAAFRSLQKKVPEEPSMAAAASASPPLRRVEKPELGFALSFPDDWREERPDPFNGAQEIARFIGPGPGVRNCLVFRNRTEPELTAGAAARRVVPVLERRGFGNFTHHDVVLAGRPAARVDFDRPAGEGTWSVRHYFVVAGDAPFCVSFGTSMLEQDAALLDTLAATFTFLEPEALPPPTPPALRLGDAHRERFRHYSLRAHRVLTIAHEQATRCGVALDQAHLLAGVATVPESVGLGVLARCGLPQEELQRAVDTILVPVPEPDASAADPGASPDGALLALSERAEQTLQLAEGEARALGATVVGVEHLVLGLLQVPGPACDLLAQRGITLDRARAALPG